MIQGIQKSVTSSVLSSSKTFLAGSADGRIAAFSDFTSGEAIPLTGESHSNYVSGIASTANSIYSVGYDDRVRKLTGKSIRNSATPSEAPHGRKSTFLQSLPICIETQRKGS